MSQPKAIKLIFIADLRQITIDENGCPSIGDTSFGPVARVVFEDGSEIELDSSYCFALQEEPIITYISATLAAESQRFLHGTE